VNLLPPASVAAINEKFSPSPEPSPSPAVAVGGEPTGKTTVMSVVTKAGIFGFGGWAAENALYGPRFSGVFGKHKLPFLPIYAAGGLAVLAIAPHIAHLPFPIRAVIYAAVLGGLEYAGCKIDRDFLKNRAWDYGQSDALAVETKGCVDWTHALMWGGLGLLAEQLA